MSSNPRLGFDIDLGPVRVTVETDHVEVILYLREFYQVIDNNQRDPSAAWTVRALLARPDPDMALTPWHVGYRADPQHRVLTIHSENERNLSITTRKAIREVLLVYCETHRYTMLHASALADDQRMIIVVGDKGSGKTTLALNGALTMGYRYLSNDHLILYRRDRSLVVTSLPTPIPIKIGTYLDYEDQLGEPWENEGVDIEAFRRMPRRQRYGYDSRLLFTFARLGQRNPLHTLLEQREVTVVLAGYGPDDRPGRPTPVTNPQAALWPHVRFDWVFDPELNTHHLPRDEHSRDAYAQDSRDLLTDLAASARIVQWRHRGRLHPLLDWLDQGATS